MFQAALYCRISKEDFPVQCNDESESIQNQKILLTEFALKNGFLIYKIYIDEDYSGLDNERPAFHSMLKDAKEKKFDVILCKTQSRFTRDMEMVEKYVHGLFPVWGIRLIGVVDDVDTDKKENKKIRQINALINEWYCEDLSENIRSVYKTKMRQGQYLGAFAPYGYKKDEKDKHKLVIDAEAAEVVKKIFRYYIEGYTTKKICYKLQQEHILPPSIYRKRKGFYIKVSNFEKYTENDFTWGSTTIRKILKNEVYIGTLIQGKEKKLSYKSKKVVAVPREEWIVLKNNHEAILSQEEFDKVQKMLQFRRKVSKIDDVEQKVYPLAGKVKCKACNGIMIRSGNYLRCGLASKSASKKCSNHTIKYNVLEKEVLYALQNYVIDVLNNEKNIKQKNDLLSLKDLDIAFKRHQTEKDLNTLDENLHLKLYADDTKKTKDATDNITILKDSLSISQFDNNDQIVFTKLTNELVYDFIDFIEIEEKKQKKAQNVIIHWNF